MSMTKNRLSFLASFALLGLTSVSLSSCGWWGSASELVMMAAAIDAALEDSVSVKSSGTNFTLFEPTTQAEEPTMQIGEPEPQKSKCTAQLDELERLIDQWDDVKAQALAYAATGHGDGHEMDVIEKYLEKTTKVLDQLRKEEDNMTSEEKLRLLELGAKVVANSSSLW